MPTYTRLQGVTDYNRPGLSRLIEANVIDFFNWGCIQAGGYVDVPVTTPGTIDPYGDETLTPVHKEGTTDGKVWQAPNPAWCHESGFEDGVAPVIAQGVYVNGTYYPTASTTGAYAHRLDFPQGLVVFSNPLLQTSRVQVAHSYRRANFVRAGLPWFRAVVLDGFLSDQAEAGIKAVFDANRLQTPVVVVEVVSVDGMSGYELGGSSRWTRPDVLFHVLASNKDDRDRLSGLIVGQFDKTIVMYDLDARAAADDFELDARGSRRTSASSYAQAVEAYYYNAMTFKDLSSFVQPTSSALYSAVCRARLELVVGRI